jgi:hypothetical protein
MTHEEAMKRVKERGLWGKACKDCAYYTPLTFFEKLLPLSSHEALEPKCSHPELAMVLYDLVEGKPIIREESCSFNRAYHCKDAKYFTEKLEE